MADPYLELRVGREIKQVPVGAKLIIGRQAELALSGDSMASRNHAAIQLVGQDYILSDLKSRNGTFVNGQEVTSVALAPNDIITIGQTEMRFILPHDEQTDFDLDVLSDDDLVEVDSHEANAPAAPVAQLTVSNYEEALEKLANAMPDQSFSERDIELINARGAAMHDTSRELRSGARQPVDLFRLLLLFCFRSHASDIHIEPRQDSLMTRVRIDGTMVDIMQLPVQFGSKLTTLVKVLSDIDIAHRNAIQEGHFTATVPTKAGKGAKRRIDFRVSFAPALHGQKLVMRILDPQNGPMRVSDLALPAWMYEEVGRAIRQDAGMVLVSGPTGSGKTTTLYSLIRSIETTRRNVVTIEDPVEIQIENVTQIPVDEAHGKSFSELLRSLLRQDPDVILVGEIRDSETARIAMQAAITGHLVFSTVHTRDTLGTVFRLLDLGIEPYLVAQGLQLVLAQRLVRKLCPHCKRAVPPTEDQIQAMGPLGEKVSRFYAPRGCVKCLGTGFMGRVGFFELLRVTDALRDVILQNPTMKSIQESLAQTKFISLEHSAHQLVADGVVSFEEVEKAVGRER